MGQDDKRIEVVAEYLNGGVTVRELERKYGTSRSAIHRWIKEYDAGKGLSTKEPERQVAKDTEMSTGDVKQLRKELEEARLYNKLLNAMIDIAEEEFRIPIRKKSGAKQ